MNESSSTQSDNTAAENPLKSKKLTQYIATIAVCFGTLCSGTVAGWTENTSDDLLKGNLNSIKVGQDELSWIRSLSILGAVFCIFTISPLCNYLGKRRATLFQVVPFTLGWLIIIFAQNIYMIYFGRVICGYAGGNLFILTPIYIAEIAQKEIRGSLTSFFELFYTAGKLISYVLGSLCSAKTTAIILLFFPYIFAAVFFKQTQSPHDLLREGKNDEAKRCLQRLRGKYYKINEEFGHIKEDLHEERVNKISLLQSFKKKETKWALFISLGLMFFQQTCGLNAVLYYAPNIFNAAGISERELSFEMETIIIGLVQLFSNTILVLTIDHFGRRSLIYFSGLLMTISEILIAIYSTLSERYIVSSNTITAIGFIPLLCLFIFASSSEVGYGPVSWIISLELFPAEVRTTFMALSESDNCLLSFLITKFYFNIRDSLGSDVTFYIFSGISLLGTIFSILFVPETKGKSMIEIQNMLKKKTISKLQ